MQRLAISNHRESSQSSHPAALCAQCLMINTETRSLNFTHSLLWKAKCTTAGLHIHILTTAVDPGGRRLDINQVHVFYGRAPPSLPSLPNAGTEPSRHPSTEQANAVARAGDSKSVSSTTETERRSLIIFLFLSGPQTPQTQRGDLMRGGGGSAGAQ